MQSRLLWIVVMALTFSARAQDPASPCNGWKAWRTGSASHPSMLYITADCELPTPGHKVELVPAVDQGNDKTVLVLNELIHAAGGLVAQVITPYKLHYRRKLRENYSDVLILPAGTKVHIEDNPKKASNKSEAK